MSPRPTVLAFSGHDPSGGAGIHADIEAIASHGCHAASVITVLTEQDTVNVRKLFPQSSSAIISQARTILADEPVKCIKIGLLGEVGIVEAIATILKDYPNIPVVLDPILTAGGGLNLSNADLIVAIKQLLMPMITVLTPNTPEAKKLAGFENLDQCGLALLDLGCQYVLITGTHETSAKVNNRLYHDGKCVEVFAYERLPHNYHGSGCTLAASIAALLVRDLPIIEAVRQAQGYTWQSLAAGYQPGKGQHVPNRLFWRDNG